MTKMQAIVIRTAGNQAIAGQIMRGLESKELAMLKAELKVLRKRDNAAWARKLMQTRRKYDREIKSHGRLYNAFWGVIGMLVLLRKEQAA